MFAFTDKRMDSQSQTKHWLLGLRPGRPVDNGPQEEDYSARVAMGERESRDKKDKPGSPTFPFLQTTQAE